MPDQSESNRPSRRRALQLGGVGMGAGVGAALLGARPAAAAVNADAFFPNKAAVANTTVPAGVDVICILSYATAGDGGGACYKRVSGGAGNGRIKSATDYFEIMEPIVTPQMLGSPQTQGQDASAFITQAIKLVSDGICSEVYIPEGAYDLQQAIVPLSDVRVTASAKAELYQLAAVAINTTAGSFITRFGWTGGRFHYAVEQKSKLHRALDLKAHNFCTIDTEFTGYNDQIIHFIKPDRKSTTNPQNVVANHYHLTADDCRVGIWYQGLESSYDDHPGNGTQRDFTVGFPVSWPGDLLVAVLTPQLGLLKRQDFSADYTFTTGGAGDNTVAATIRLSSAPPAGSTIMLWPSQPSYPGCPISGNTVDLWLNDVTERGVYAVRYVDSEQYYGHMRLNANDAVDFDLNPISLRNAETDFFNLHGVVTGASPKTITDYGTVRVMTLGPGSNRILGTLLFDRGYPNGVFSVNDTERVPLTGTVTATNGSTTVTGVGTKFTTELQTLSLYNPGGTADDDTGGDRGTRTTGDALSFPQADSPNGRKEWAVKSVQSDTVLTLDTAFSATTLTDVPVVRRNIGNNVAYDLAVSQGGQGGSSQVGRARYKTGTFCQGSVVIDSTKVSAIARYPHTLNRTPKPSEITITLLSPTGGRIPFVQLDSINADGFTITLNGTTANPANVTVGFAVELGDF